MEHWPSGLRHRFAKPAGGESCPIGSNPICSAKAFRCGYSVTVAPEIVILLVWVQLPVVTPRGFMSDLQTLLDKQANLSNRHEMVVRQIIAMRGITPPRCWGMDDCSTIVLSQCPWRVDCDSYQAQKWQDENPCFS